VKPAAFRGGRNDELPMFKFLSKLFKNDSGLRKVVEEINALEGEIKALTDEELRREGLRLKEKVQARPNLESSQDLSVLRRPEIETLDEFLPRAFALVRETARRTLGQRHFDVQLMAGAALHQGKIIEMRTGEGKTLSATAPAYLNALTGDGVHVVTVNEYLAKRDAVWMGQIYHALGLSVACLIHEGARIYDPDFIGDKSAAKHEYQESALLDRERDTTGSFLVQEDYLRPISRKEAYAADVTYGTNHEFGFDYLRDNLAHSLDQQVQTRGFSQNETRENADNIQRNSASGPRESATESTKLNFAIIDEVDSILIDEARTPLIISAPDVASSDNYKTFARIARMLNAGEDYVKDEKRRAVEITESGIEKVEKSLNIKNLYAPENLRLSHYLVESLKAQALFQKDKDYVVKNGEIILVDQFTGRLLPGRRYSGGLHQAIEAKEGVRVQQESRTYASISIQNYFRMYGKLAGMTGTAQTSAEEFHKVYNLEVATIPTNREMIRKDLPDTIYKTPDAKWRALIEEVKRRREGGQPVLIGTVSIEKNEQLHRLLSQAGVPHEVLNAKNHEREGAIIAQAGKSGVVTVATNMAGRGVDIILGGNPPSILEAEKVKNAGGLHVIGTERHESRRIDNQLRGRSGRQGDPGSSQFFLSLDDDLMRVFGGDRLKNMMNFLNVLEDMPIESKVVSKAVSQAQSRVEGFNFDARKHLLDYDDVLNKQRKAIYKKRQEILASGKYQVSSVSKENSEPLSHEIALSREIVTRVLQMLDFLWMSHLENMEALSESVRLRAYGQHDPLVEYRREGKMLYEQMVADFESWLKDFNQAQNGADGTRNIAEIPQSIQQDSAFSQRSSAADFNVSKIGRNDPCHCGSGKKYKKCHMTQG